MYRALFLCLLAVAGCERRRTETANPFRQEESGFVLEIIVDQKLIQSNQNTFEFTNSALDRYFQDRIGNENDQLIIAQISADKRSLLWQGTPQALREEFATPEAFHNMLYSRATRGEPIVHDGIVQALKYLMTNRSVASGKAQSAVLVLCDLMDQGPDTEASEKRLLDAFIKYIESGGLVGFYYLSQDAYFKWDENFKNAGHPFVPIECDVHGKPKLPDFEDIHRPFK